MVGINTFPSTLLWSNKAYTNFCVFGFKIVYTDKKYPITLDLAILFSQPFLHFLCVPLSVGANSFQMSISLLLLRDPQPKTVQLSPGIAIYDLLSCKMHGFLLIFNQNMPTFTVDSTMLRIEVTRDAILKFCLCTFNVT